MLGERIQNLLEARAMSQSELARRVKVRQSTISDLIHGHSSGSKHIHKIARELGTTPAYLAGETNDQTGAATEERLSSEEQRLLEIYRALPKKDRAALKVLLERMAADESPSAWKSQRRANRG